ncbi:MAG: RDD family protein [Elusimicrobiales bacterium]|nr:RDD family protein [Elusimicrobiales bacterium]
MEEKLKNFDININDISVKKNLENSEKTFFLAGFNERFLAYVIDVFPFVFLNFYTLSLAVKNNYIIYSDTIETKWKIFWILLFILYEVIFTSGGRVTLGKKILGIKVIHKNGGNLNLFQAFIRVIGYFISSFTINIGYLIALFTPNKRALHDFLASSVVIRTKEKSPFVEGVILIISWACLAFLVGSWLNRTILAVTPYEQKQINEAKRTLLKLAKLQEIHYRKYGFYTNDIKRLAELTGNVKAVRYELSKTLSEGSLEIASDGKNFIISAKAKNWRKTRVEVSSGMNLKENE